jgi:hypothetical protein
MDLKMMTTMPMTTMMMRTMEMTMMGESTRTRSWRSSQTSLSEGRKTITRYYN